MIQNTPLACVILAAGQGTRMKSDLHKTLHPVAGLPMISHVLNACAELSAEQIVVVTAPDAEDLQKAIAPITHVVQPVALGTGDAVKAARKQLEKFKGDVLVLYGDTPLITAASLNLLRQRRADAKATIVVAGFETENPASYGRLIVDKSGNLGSIIETSEATAEQKKIRLCNGGVMLFDGAKIWGLLDRLRDNNAKKEFFLTDCISLAAEQGDVAVVATIPADDVLGVNNRIELAQAEKIMQRRLREKAMLAGVTLTDPGSVFLSVDTVLGRDVTIGPNVVIGAGVEIADRAEIRAFCQIEQAKIGVGAIIGPFARVRPGSDIGPDAHIGNFVEIKNSSIGPGSKVNHLSYVGDTTMGGKVNIGAGTITANYDGFRKFRTEIGDGASTGSNSVMVAPVKVGAGAYVGAGSVITNDVPADALAVARGRQENREDWARRMRDDKSK